MTNEDYIDHEVRIRMQELCYKQLDGKLNLLIALLVGSVVIPIVLHAFKLI